MLKLKLTALDIASNITWHAFWAMNDAARTMFRIHLKIDKKLDEARMKDCYREMQQMDDLTADIIQRTWSRL
jgi:hypothetical protein